MNNKSKKRKATELLGTVLGKFILAEKGIPEEVVEDIFIPFTSSSARIIFKIVVDQLKLRFTGLGIGASCRDLVVGNYHLYNKSVILDHVIFSIKENIFHQLDHPRLFLIYLSYLGLNSLYGEHPTPYGRG